MKLSTESSMQAKIYNALKISVHVTSFKQMVFEFYLINTFIFLHFHILFVSCSFYYFFFFCYLSLVFLFFSKYQNIAYWNVWFVQGYSIFLPEVFTFRMVAISSLNNCYIVIIFLLLLCIKIIRSCLRSAITVV